MPRIAGLRKETEVGELKLAYHFHLLSQKLHVLFFLKGGVGKQQDEKENVEDNINQKQARFSHKHYWMP
jgi:hypothetical protein